MYRPDSLCFGVYRCRSQLGAFATLLLLLGCGHYAPTNQPEKLATAESAPTDESVSTKPNQNSPAGADARRPQLEHDVPRATEKGSKQVDELQGIWIGGQDTLNGKPLPDGFSSTLTCVFRNGKVESFSSLDGERSVANFKIDVCSTPYKIHLEYESDKKKRVARHAIYELNNDKMKLCLSDGSNEAACPREFRSSEQTKEFLWHSPG
jgi:uncharacterized protein (TIGR03067 family)